MWGYYVRLALRSSGRSLALTWLVIVLIGCGVATCMVCYAVFRVTTGDPIPSRSARLFVPQVDNFGPGKYGSTEPPVPLSYTDAMAVARSTLAEHHALIYAATWIVEPGDARVQPIATGGDAVTADFFPMFAVPFAYGSAWTASDDAGRAAVVVIGRKLNERLFAGKNSVGRELQLDGRAYRIVGVLDTFNPRPRFFDVASQGPLSAFEDAGQVFVPFNRAIDVRKAPQYDYCSAVAPGVGDWQGYLHGECNWISAWVDLPTPASVERYRDYLKAYAGEQQRSGRFAWAPNVRLHGLMEWMSVLHVVPKASSLSMLVSFSFLVVALVNVIGLMLARFMRRAPEIGVRRALGASKRAIGTQFLIEATMVGAAGGVFGVILTMLGTWGVDGLFESGLAQLVRIDAGLLTLTLLVAVMVTVLAAIYPVWRATAIQPGWQVKING